VADPGVCILEAGELRAELLPRFGLVVSSLAHRGEELLGRVDELRSYIEKGSTLGIPLLHPWANRLAGLRYSAAGADVVLDRDSPLLQLDANGLPIHGVPGAQLAWEVAGASVRKLSATHVWERPELLAVFPFPHLLRVEAALDPSALTLTTTLTATGERAVPVSFGYHPYLTLPGAPRESWTVRLPAMRRLVLDERGIPIGESEPYPGLDGPLGRAYDDGFGELPERPSLSVEGGGRRIAVTFLAGYPYAQVFAPPGREYVALEPMTAPTSALVSGTGLRLVQPGASFRASFRIDVSG